MQRKFLYLMAAALSLSCAPTNPNTGASAARRNENVISRDEIVKSGAGDAYEAISRLRPQFLRTRGTTTMNVQQNVYANVYVNGQRRGGINALRSLDTSQILEIHYYNALDATSRYGTDNASGAIDVITH